MKHNYKNASKSLVNKQGKNTSGYQFIQYARWS